MARKHRRGRPSVGFEASSSMKKKQEKNRFLNPLTSGKGNAFVRKSRNFVKELLTSNF